MRIDLGKNLDNVEVSDGFEPIPPGNYTVQVSKVPEVKTGKKAPYVSWEFEIVESDNPDLNGRKIFHNTSLSDKALGMPTGIKALLQSIGLGWDETGFDGAQAVGLRCSVDVINRPDPSNPDKIYDDIEVFYEAY